MINYGKEDKAFETGAVRSSRDAEGNLKGRMDLIPWEAVRLLSIHMERALEHYPAHNCDLGIPQSSLLDSAMRHGAKYIAGWTDEDHLVAMAWNVMLALQQTVTKPELVDIPWRKEE